MRYVRALGNWLTTHPLVVATIALLLGILLTHADHSGHRSWSVPFLIGLINLDPINTATTKTIMPGLADSFFKNDPLLLFLKLL